MRRFCLYLALVLSAMTPSCVQAMQFAHGPYYASVVSDRRGSELLRLEAAASFMWLHQNVPCSGSRCTEIRHHMVCSLRKIVPESRGAALREELGRYVATIFQDKTSAKEVRIILAAHHACDIPLAAVAKKITSVKIFVDSKGVLRSANPAWNACIAGGQIDAATIRANRNVFEHRRGHVRVYIPYSCRDYHRGPLSIWQHPDYPELSVMIDAKGRLKSMLPEGYVVEKMPILAKKK